MADVLLVCMPFGPVFSPALGLSLLKASLHRHGVGASVRYFSIRFAELIGQHFYCGVALEGRPPTTDLAGEWVFAAALAEAPLDDEGYVEQILRAGRTSAPAIRKLQGARAQAAPFLDWCVAEVVAARPRVVGFTSVFQQHIPSLALAKRIKRALPDTVIVFGGANCEGVMGAETLRSFPFVDAVVSGEGDAAFPDLVQRVLAGTPLDGLAGVRTHASVGREFTFGAFPNTPVVPSLDDLPYPDFTDYAAQWRASKFNRDWLPSVPFETSRGCWWGARHHCTFCGLNGTTLAFRSKSPERALAELTDITRRYRGCDVEVVDNILDMQYFRTLLPALAQRRPRVTLFYETKANLKKEQVRILRDAGVTEIQPGIESFGDRVLALMRKGVTGLQNVQLLKWCKELGVHPAWNIIWGFPGEPAEEYARMTALVPMLTHLPPPHAFSALRLDRFSPNFMDAAGMGFSDVRPLDAYRHVYALRGDAIRNLAYFFEFEYQDGRDPHAYVQPLRREVRAWQRAHRSSDLFMVDVDDRLLIWDFRPAAKQTLTVLTGADRTLYLACDEVREVRDKDAQHRLSRFIDLRLMIAEGDRYLALAIPVGEYRPAPEMWRRTRHVKVHTAADGTMVVRGVPRGPA